MRALPNILAFFSTLIVSITAFAQPADAPAVTPVTPVTPATPDGPEGPRDVRDRARALAERATEAFAKGAYEEAEKLLREQLALQPRNFVIHYNLASVRGLQGDGPGSISLLLDAVDNGFTDIALARRDPALELARAQPDFAKLVDRWPDVLLARLEANLAGNRTLFDKAPGFEKGYADARDERLRLAYLSAFDARSFDAARSELVRLAQWANASVMPGILDPDQQREDAWVVVVLPTRPHFNKWAISVYGPGAIRTNSMIAGSYEHDPKRLVSMDLGSTLRHEFFHALHWRDMTRRGQRHPIWIMEGLCSLVEDYEAVPASNGAPESIRPVPSWRTNVAKRLDTIRALQPIEKLATMPQLRFTGSRPLANYAQARAVFLFLSDNAKLGPWYEHYVTQGYEADPSGVASIEAVMGAPIAEVNEQFKAWLRALPKVAEEIKPGMASLGIEVDTGTGEGPVVLSIDRPARGDKRPGLKVNDIITAIDGKAVRDIAELVRVLSAYKPGDTVTVSYRRFRLFEEAEVTLVEKR
jgi:tetratricopeptide (TPR) repeat protein